MSTTTPIQEPSAWMRQAWADAAARLEGWQARTGLEGRPTDVLASRLVDDGEGTPSRDPRFCCRCRQIVPEDGELYTFTTRPREDLVLIGQHCGTCRRLEEGR